MTGKSMPSSPALPRDYYPRAASWAEDRQDHLRRSRTLAWAITILVALIAALEAVALAALAPLKTVVPYTLLVDRHTGYVQVLKGLDAEAIKPSAALTQSYLAQYVIGREDFDAPVLRAQYRKVTLWSAQDARRDYLRLMASDNPENPSRRYLSGTVVATRIKSLSQVSPDLAMVRFERAQKIQGQAPTPPEALVAMVRYRFSGAPMSLDDRLLNPLGFQVVEYRLSQEALPETAASAEHDQVFGGTP